MRYAVALLLNILVSIASAEPLLRVADAQSGEPLAAVTIHPAGREGHVVTDASGGADAAAFGSFDKLVFQKAGYFHLELSRAQLESRGFIVRLVPRIYTTGEYTVTTTRFHTARADLPQAATDVSPSAIAFQNPQTSADVLAATGEVFVQKSQLGGGSPMLRGFAANSVLLMVDGVRMNNAIFRSGNLQNIIQIDANALERATVLFGPGSVQFGSDALGGVMHFETLEPAFATDDKLAVSAAAFVRTATANSEQTSHADLSIARGSLASATSLTYSDFGDLRAGAARNPGYAVRTEYAARVNGEDVAVPNDNVNVQKPSGYSQFNFLQKLAWRPLPRVKLGYGLHWTTSSRIPRYDRLIEYRNNTLRDAEWYYGPQKWLMNTLAADATGQGWCDNARLVLAQQRQEESRHDRRFGRNTLTSRTETVDIYSLNADFEKRLAPARRLLYGLEIVHNDVASEAQAKNIVTGEISPASTRYPDGGSRLSSLAAYAGHQWKLRVPVTITTGVRYSWMTLHSEFEDTTFYKFPFDEIDLDAGALTASAGAVWQPDSQFRLSAGLASGFRAPNVDDIGKIFDSQPGSVVMPNPDLGPEYSYNVEVGAEKCFGEGLSVGGSAYYTWIENVMVRRDFTFNGQDSILYDGTMSRVQAIVNAGRGYVAGFNVHARAEFTSDLSLRSTLTYTEGRDLKDDVPLRHIPPLFGETRLTYERPKWVAEAFACYNAAKPLDELAPEEQAKTHLYTADGTPAWYTLNARGGWKIHRALELQLALENILDHHYRPMSSGISAAGRNLIVALRTRF